MIETVDTEVTVMSINIQAKTNYSFLFSGLSSAASNAASGNWLSDYASIKNGSYGKLMKAYYGKDNNASRTAASTITKKDTTTDTAKKALAKVETATDALKESADALLATGKKDLFAQKDITTKDENGVETTTKGYDTNAIYNAVNSFVKDYNSVMGAVDVVSDTTVNNRTESMGNTTIANSRQLAKIGIALKNDGTLSLDKDTFMKADMNTVKNLFQGNGSYGYRISAQSSMINFAADHASGRASLYTGTAGYTGTYNAGNLFSSYM